MCREQLEGRVDGGGGDGELGANVIDKRRLFMTPTPAKTTTTTTIQSRR